jgi:hypothetical protein
VASQGPRYPTIASTVGNAGTSENSDAWSGPGNIVSDNGTEAVITAASYDSPDISQLLFGWTFGFTIPGTATIDGIIVEIDRRNSAGAASDNRVQLGKGTAFADLVGDNKADTATDWPTTTAIATYGGSTDLWGTTWTPTEINASTFSVWLSVQADAANTDIQVDFIRITVHYTEGSTDVTVTPSPVTVPLSIPTPTIAAGRILTPDPVTIPLVLPAPTVSAGAGAVTVTPDPVAIPLAVPAPAVVVGTTIDVAAFRFRNDDGSETTATWKAAQNVDVSIAEDTVFRLRYELQETQGIAVIGSDADFVLRYRLNGGSWLVVGAESGTVLVPGTSTNVADVDPTTDQLTAGTGTFSAGSIEEGNGRVNGSAIAASGHIEYEFVLTLPAADVTDGDVIDVEIIQEPVAYGGPANRLNVTQTASATITVGSGAVTVTPDPVAVPLAVPAPTVAAGRVLTPRPVAVPLVIPTPAVGAGRVVTPDPVAVPLVIPAPTVTAHVAVTVTPSPVAVPLVIPTPTVVVNALVAPSPVAVPLAIPTPTVTAGRVITPSPVAIPLVIPAPTITTGTAVTVTPSPVAITLAIPTPTILNASGPQYPPDETFSNPTPPSVPAVPALLTPTGQAEWPAIQYTRVSDVAGQRNDYSRLAGWNSDQSLILLGMTGVATAILDGSTYAFIRNLNNLPGFAQWANTDPNKIYGTWPGDATYGSSLVSVNANVQANTITVEHDFDADGFTEISLGDGEGGLSDDDRWIVLMTKTAGGDHGMLMYDRDLDVVHATLDFGPSSWPDTCFVSRKGNYAFAYWSSINGGGGDGTGTNEGLWIYDRDLTNPRQITTEARHGDPGIDQHGDEVWVAINTDGNPAQMWRLSDLDHTYLLPQVGAEARGHVSCRNTGRDGWAYFSVFDYPNTASLPYGRDQMYAVKLDGSGTVEVFGWSYHRNDGESSDSAYRSSPFAVPSRDGRLLLYGTEHGDLTDPYTTYAYIAEVAGVTVTPDPVAVPLAIPTPTVTAGRVLTPSPVTIPLATPAPTVTAGRIVTPSPVSVAITTVAPTVRASVAIAPSPVAIPLVIPDPTIAVTAGDIILTPDPVALELVIPAPTLAVGRIITPTPVGIALVIPAPTVAGLSLAIAGKTRDRNGTAIGNVTVRAFRTADDVFVGETTSDFTGSFSVEVGAGEHYLVGYKAGSPDIAGTTVNTLVGS